MPPVWLSQEGRGGVRGLMRWFPIPGDMYTPVFSQAMAAMLTESDATAKLPGNSFPRPAGCDR